MRIARILTRLNLGGPARQVLESDVRLMQLGHQVRVYCGEPEAGEGDLTAALEGQGVEVVRVPTLARAIRPMKDRRAYQFLRRELQAYDPDLVHTHASKAGWLGRMAAGGMRARVVHTFHGHVFDGHFSRAKVQGLLRIERYLARRTDQLVAVSEATRRELVARKVAPVKHIRVVYGGADVCGLSELSRSQATLRKDLGIGESDLVIGVLGRLAPIKRTHLALEAFIRAWPDLPPARLVFIGDGPGRLRLEQDLEKCAPEIKASVFLAGPWANMATMLPDLDLLLSASRHEGLPISMVEAGACGVPSVATPVGGVGEFVVPGMTGWVGKDVPELAAGLVALGVDAELRSRMGRGARDLALRQHDGDGFADRLERLYWDTLEGTP
ncbi:MAG: glycosyltransferase family 4 protein [Planctomycetota bacterium]|nr:glycosyltransferase family 4 protein [Planctomycetota bacterium]